MEVVMDPRSSFRVTLRPSVSGLFLGVLLVAFWMVLLTSSLMVIGAQGGAARYGERVGGSPSEALAALA
jgi:hypothetical protein